jgi:hypothetical protein
MIHQLAQSGSRLLAARCSGIIATALSGSHRYPKYRAYTDADDFMISYVCICSQILHLSVF